MQTNSQPMEAFRYGAVPAVVNAGLRQRLVRLEAAFPVSTQHRQNFRHLGCEYVYVASVTETRFNDCWLVLVRLGTILEVRFGISSEIPAIYSPHADLQSRTVDSIETILMEVPSDRQSFTKEPAFFAGT